jgi:hypothetical protein
MNMHAIYSLTIATAFNLCFCITTAQADIDRSNIAYYKFQDTRVATIQATRSYMDRFLPKEKAVKLEPSEDNIVRYVSDNDVNTTLEHNLVTGDLSFNRKFSRYIGEFTPKLPDDEQAVEIAMAFLEENQLMPTRKEQLKVAHIGGLRSNIVDKDGNPGPVIDKLRTISFSRSLGNLPVIGAGSKVVVNIGDRGEVIGVIKRWRELSAPKYLKDNEILTEKEALKKLKAQIALEFGKESQWDIASQQLAYYDNNDSVIQPVYAYQTKIQLANSNIPPIDYIAIVPAMVKPIEDLNLMKTDDRALSLIQHGNPAVPNENTRGNE